MKGKLCPEVTKFQRFHPSIRYQAFYHGELEQLINIWVATDSLKRRKIIEKQILTILKLQDFSLEADYLKEFFNTD